MELKPGAITGNIRLVRPIGQGASGAVWVAYHRVLNVRVAVKLTASDADDEVIERFQREAALSAAIDSPYVARIHEHGTTDDGRPYLVMDLLEGETLDERLRRGPLALDEVARLVGQVAMALQAAHALGIVHRDVKPANIFLESRGGQVRCKVLDFGIAKQLTMPRMDGLTGKGIIVGTPAYMSPEQCTCARDVTAATDLWGLAVVTYVALTGHKPFDAPSVSRLWAKIIAGIFVPPSAHDPRFGPELDAWFARGLHRVPESRFRSARELALALLQIAPASDTLAAELETAPPVPAEARSPEPPPLAVDDRHGDDTLEPAISEPSTPPPPAASPRRRRLAAAAAVVGALLLGSVAWSLRTPSSAAQPPAAAKLPPVAQPPPAVLGGPVVAHKAEAARAMVRAPALAVASSSARSAPSTTAFPRLAASSRAGN